MALVGVEAQPQLLVLSPREGQEPVAEVLGRGAAGGRGRSWPRGARGP